jgi:signal transduction histidine kinase
LNPLVRDEALRIAGEALRNAFRHSGARSITVEIRYETRQLCLFIRDDGKGVNEETLRGGHAGHFGLRGMRERAEIVGGRLEVWSKPGAGTQVQLSVPSGIAYDGFAQRSWLSQILLGHGSSMRTRSHK